MTFIQLVNSERNSVQSVTWPQLQHEMVMGLFTKLTKFRVSPWTAKGLESNWGAKPASGHDRTRPLWRWKSHGLERDHHDWEDKTPHLPEECRWALLQRKCHWAYCCALSPSAWECIYLSRRQCKSQSCTCCPKSPAVSQNHDCPMASEVQRPVSYWTFEEHPRETCPETASQATGHQRARWGTPGGMVPDLQPCHWAAHREHEASLSHVLAANGGSTRYWEFCEINILTLIKLEVESKSRDSLKTLSLMITVLSRYFNAITWNYKSDSKQNVFVSF